MPVQFGKVMLLFSNILKLAVSAILLIVSIYFFLTLISYRELDQTLSSVSSFDTKNIFGNLGANVAYLLFTSFGIYSFILIYHFFIFSKYLIDKHSVSRPIEIIILHAIVGIIPTTLTLTYISSVISAEFLSHSGFGGMLGIEVLSYINTVLDYFHIPEIFHIFIFIIIATVSFISLYKSMDFQMQDLIKMKNIFKSVMNFIIISIKSIFKKRQKTVYIDDNGEKIEIPIKRRTKPAVYYIKSVIKSFNKIAKWINCLITRKIKPDNIEKQNFIDPFSIPDNFVNQNKEEIINKDPTCNSSENIPIVKDDLNAKEKVNNDPMKIIDKPYLLPSVDLLQKMKVEKLDVLNMETNRQKAIMLENALMEYGLSGKITDIKAGPVITLFEMEPGEGIKISQIKNLNEDIARKLETLSVRISVIAGTNKIGLELPNTKRQLVGLRSQLESSIFTETEHRLPISLGASINGTPVFVDLSTMPHLLIAGTTGSGKSVGVNGMILSLIYKYTPDECKFIMIDPKMVEFSGYEDIPHLLLPIVIDTPRAIAALKWVAAEMDDRYLNMRSIGVKDIVSFNKKVEEIENKTITRKVDTGFDPQTGEIISEDKKITLKKLPYIVVVVDELADLMQVAKKEVEGTIARLAAKARAAGIHLIFSTQRPSVDVITGTIKSNFPIRISYQVASGQDSRTILDEYGAELMLGKGDMLYRSTGGHTVRIHGAFVSEAEIEKVVNFIKAQRKPEYVELKIEPVSEMGQNNPMTEVDKLALREAKNDDLYNKALEIIFTTKKTSISFLQRQLGIGYNKSANLIEKMEREGILSAPDSTGKRSILHAPVSI